MKISIVTISYNQSAFLERAIRSVLEQDYTDIEYIVVDPGSTDDSRDIIERYRGQISKVIYEPDKGPADGLNKGFAVATGEIFGYLNADDEYLPGTIGEVAQHFLIMPDADIIYGNGYIIDEDDYPVRRLFSDTFNLHRYLYGAVMVLQQATFFRRQAFLQADGFNIENRTSWDRELLVNMALARKRSIRVNRYWGLFRIHPDSISGSGRSNNFYLADLARLRTKCLGKSANKRLVLKKWYYRGWKWIFNPRVIFFHLYEKLFGIPKRYWL